jgi:hypothetical protein
MIVDQEPQSFMDYWNDVDAALKKHFGIDTSDAGIEPDVIAGAQEEGQTPEGFALWLGEKYGLKTVESRVPVSLFELGRIVATQGALAACSPQYMAQCLGRHVRGDWGCIDAEDREANFAAILSGERILSAYPIDPAKPCEGFGANTLWIITERDRSATTFLLPGEY